MFVRWRQAIEGGGVCVSFFFSGEAGGLGSGGGRGGEDIQVLI